MSSFASKRKARVIKADDDEEPGSSGPVVAGDAPVKEQNDASQTVAPVKFTRKPFRQSGLRKSINVNEDKDTSTTGASAQGPSSAAKADADEDDDGPVVVRPTTLGRSGSTRNKKRALSSRLSFGPGQDAGDGGDAQAVVTPKKSTLGQQALENSAVKKSSAFSQRLPLRRFGDDDDDDGRPKYSKEYLAELQSSTPNTPQNISKHKHADEMELDESELEGALIVNEGEFASAPAPPPKTQILTDMEIQERKQRRARLAAEEQDDEFISLSDDENPFRKKASDTRLLPEDEDLGEGFDDLVEDGGLSLGKKAEREAKKKRRDEMKERIKEAEGLSGDESEDSDAERRAAFEAAQTRSGMGGFGSNPAAQRGPGEALRQVPPKMTPLSDLEKCFDTLTFTLQSLETELQEKRARVTELKDEKEEIIKREGEVQGLLNEAGKKYTATVNGGAATGVATAPGAEAGVSPARQIQNAGMSELAVERGLESFGTPTQRPDVGEE